MTDHNADAGGGGFGSTEGNGGGVNVIAAAATAATHPVPPRAVPDASAWEALAAARERDIAFLRGAAAASNDGESAKSKRTAEIQISKDDYNRGENGEVINPELGFKKADTDILAKRRIIKVRRPEASLTPVTATATNTETTTSTTTAAEATASSNPFASLRLPAPNASASAISLIGATATAVANPFASIAFKASSTAPTTSTDTPGSIFGSSSGFPKFGSGVFGGASTAAGASNGTGVISTSLFGMGASTSTNGTSSSTAASSSWFSPPPAGTSPFAFASAPVAAGSATTTSSDTAVGASAATGSTEPKKEILPEHVELSTGEEGEELIIEMRVRTYKRVLESAETNGTRSGTSATGGVGAGDQDGVTPSVPPSSSTAPMLAKAAANGDHDDQKAAAAVADHKDYTKGTAAATGDSKEQKSTDGAATTTANQDSKPLISRWQEIGVGPLRLLERTANVNSSRLVQRRESTPNGPATKVILNVPLWKETTVQRPSEKHVQVTTLGYDDSAEGGAAATPVPETYLFKLKTPMEAAQLRTKIEESAAKAKSCVVGGGDTDDNEQ